ncbi:MAG: glycosyltransferase family 2 protein, partial [Methylosarcina sp.]
YHGHRNLVWTFIKDMPGILFWLLLPLHVLLNLVSVVYFVSRDRGRVILRAKRDALKGIPKMLKKRRKIQQSRKASIAAIWHGLDKRWLPFR